ncbi:LysR substrate-binding domain-containing protein [Vibrio breoganii]|uniref:LysR substrate-binding domain-containing protein n=1 Tax=Vibrio breoganii TaxID=553239 RepID=UPI000314653F|nr:LysR substrate-binding domain-containing protein [Vibrio breoganii]OED97146.1 LysR family transcriptional regulator [Vibrio breoganii ZF-29]PMK21404.1 LysR family transcriptional regulator [Vibrio breoganii]PMK71601.1 LysR family transcriptional regulator [Vibrio breoganii]PML13468.1 LysR family transcriptional regulator [Vibrio breoganii]PML39831.1 LysR family transcriptional regulator [Vibrio breoganii]
MYNNISIDALRALDAIERKGSFAAAAESLYKVPSALTYTIKKLEDEVGTPLFDRSKQRAQLTAAGRLVLEHGREILLATNRLYDSVHELESGWESEIRLARDTIVPEQKIFPLISKFNNLQQKVDVNLGVEVLGGGWDALHSRRADIVIGANGELPKGLFSTHKMGEISFVFALSPKHPLANFPNTISNEQLQDYASIVVSDTSQILPVRDSGLFKSRQLIRVNSMESKIAAQIEGLGVGFIPTHLAKPFLESGQLVEKECAIPRPSHEIYLAWHKDQTGKAFEWFIEHLCNLDWDL